MPLNHALFLHAKSFMASPKKYLAARRTLSAMGTQVARWTDLGNHDPAWDERTAMMARMVGENSSVLEFGSGREQLESFLPKGCTYQPSDLASRSPRTLVCDLNEGFPQLAQHYDYIIFSGVIEYIHDLDGLMQYVRQNGTQCIVSYTSTNDLDCMSTRSNNGWVNHYSDEALTKLFKRAGFEIAERQKWQQHTLYRLEMTPAYDLTAAPVVPVNRSLGNLFSNVTRTVSASGVQFLITLCTTPVMTRLYEPAAYATFGTVNTAMAVIIGIGLLSLPNAYCAEKVEQVRTEILQTMLVLLAGLVCLSTLIASALAIIDIQHDGMHIPTLSLLMLPVLVLTYGLRQISTVIAIQRARFKRVSLCQVVEPICSRGGSIGLGALIGGNPFFILLSLALGHISVIALLIEKGTKRLSHGWRKAISHLPHFAANLRRSSDFVFFGTLSQQSQQVVMLIIQLVIASCFSTEEAGQYILAISTLTLPVTLIAMSTAPVLLQHFVATEARDPSALPRQFLLAAGFYLLAGACVLLPVFFYGEAIFRIAFGQVWEHAGRIAGMLSLAYIGTFAITGVQAIFTVTRRLKLQFIMEVGTGLPALVAAVVCFKTMPFDDAIFNLSVIWCARYILLLIAALVAVFQHPRSAS